MTDIQYGTVIERPVDLRAAAKRARTPGRDAGEMSDEERKALERSAETLRNALARITN